MQIITFFFLYILFATVARTRGGTRTRSVKRVAESAAAVIVELRRRGGSADRAPVSVTRPRRPETRVAVVIVGRGRPGPGRREIAEFPVFRA